MATPKHISELIASRRALLGGLAGLPLLNLAACATGNGAAPAASPPRFASIAATNADAVTVPAGYEVHVLAAWGDALVDGIAPFDPDALTRAEQERRWGQNNDMLAIFPPVHAFPPPRRDLRDGDRLLLCANNEYFDPTLTFPAVARIQDFTHAQIETGFAATGVSVAVVERVSGAWRIARDARLGAGLNRRITPFTPVIFSGPAAHHPWISAAGARVNAAVVNGAHEPRPQGAISCGTSANCAGGQTPWGTYLTSEENFNYLFAISNPNAAPLVEAQRDAPYTRDNESFGSPVRGLPYAHLMPPQYDLAYNPHVPALYGWVVEIDPYDPSWTPRKRTALGRKKGECATTALTRDGRVVVYSGDDQTNEFVYKFVSRDRFDPADREAARMLLDDGQLYVARFEEDGSGRWIPVNLANANAAAAAQNVTPFADEADLMVRAREAGKALGATPMDRPEDVEALLDDRWVGLGPVLISCTKNSRPSEAHPGNPRRETDDPAAPHANPGGHVLRIDETGADCGATSFRWDVFLLAGDPNARVVTGRDGRPQHVSTNYGGAPTTSGDRFACPDNILIDSRYNVWIATDGADDVFPDCNDCLVATSALTTGPREVKRFLVGPPGCEVSGPIFTPDERALFVSIQHPGETNVAGTHVSELRFARGERPPSHFPDGGDSWPRSAVVVITHAGGGKIGD